MARVLQGLDELVKPSTFGVEVAARSLATGTRNRRSADRPWRWAPPHTIVTLGPKGAAAAQARAIQARLRGADALYVWLASARALTLCTLDQEMAQRGGAFCKVIAP